MENVPTDRILDAVKLTRKAVIMVIATAVVALAGLVVVQLVLLSNARRLKEQAFRDNVVNAMQTVVRQLEVREATEKTRQIAAGHAGHGVKVMAIAVSDSAARQFSDTVIQKRVIKRQAPVWIENDSLRYTVPSQGRVVIEARDSATGRTSTLVDSITPAGMYALPLEGSGRSNRNISVRIGNNESASFTFGLNCRDSFGGLPALPDSSRMLIVSQVVDNLIMGETTPIEKRLDRATLDSLLTTSFASAGIDLPFDFAVFTSHNDSLHLLSETEPTTIRQTDLRARLFPSDLFSDAAELLVHFPDRASFVTRQLLPIAIATICFMVVITLCFAYSIVTIMRQRRFAQLTVDFINNMTHEFKTPLSTVALACDALARPDVSGQSDQVQKYQGMIRDENSRMRSNVDKILQMAVLEEGDYDLTLTDIDLHAVIAAAARGAIMQVEQQGGTISFNLNAPTATVTGDAMHLTNIISNLLDNAVKYSSQAPRITITTATRDRTVVVTVADRGIGIPERDLPHLFDKYYRVRTGNRHDVKGFGIGLSYVKMMTEAMAGTVTVASKPGDGTTVTLAFPLAG